jgi:RNA polymerase sigma-70 factor (ECF subfamily)
LVIPLVVVRRLARSSDAPAGAASSTEDVAAVYAAHAPFVWATLQRMGVAPADLEDVLHEVFVVVHTRLHTFDGSSKMTTWLYGISLRVARAYRRRPTQRREHVDVDAVDMAGTGETPESDAAQAQAKKRLDAVLAELDPDKRAVFVMFEIDELPCDEIADCLGVPVGTVYSRLHAARRAFQEAIVRLQAREARMARGRLR